jgi:hypothetical protein
MYVAARQVTLQLHLLHLPGEAFRAGSSRCVHIPQLYLSAFVIDPRTVLIYLFLLLPLSKSCPTCREDIRLQRRQYVIAIRGSCFPRKYESVTYYPVEGSSAKSC